MKESLKELLHNVIRSRGYISLDEAHQIGFSMKKPKKASNVERCLRPSLSPEVETLYNEKGYVSGYKWIGETVVGPSEQEIRNAVNIFRTSVISLEEQERLIRTYPDLYREKIVEENKQSSLL